MATAGIPTQTTIEQIADGIEQVHKLCEEYGRDPGSLSIIARLGQVYPITADIIDRHRELGIHHFVVDPVVERRRPT